MSGERERGRRGDYKRQWNRVARRVIVNANYLIEFIRSRSERSLLTKRLLACAGNFYANHKYLLRNVRDARCIIARFDDKVSLPGKCFVTARGVVDWEIRTRGPKEARSHDFTYSRAYIRATLARSGTRDDSRFCVGRGFTTAAGLLTRARHRRNRERTLLPRLSPWL